MEALLAVLQTIALPTVPPANGDCIIHSWMLILVLRAVKGDPREAVLWITLGSTLDLKLFVKWNCIVAGRLYRGRLSVFKESTGSLNLQSNQRLTAA